MIPHRLRPSLLSCTLVAVLALSLSTGSAQTQLQFGPATKLVIPGSTSGDLTPSLTADNLTLYFTSVGRTGGLGGYDMFRTTRTTPTGSFGPPVALTLNTSLDELSPKTTLDGLSLYFVSTRTGTLGDLDVWISTRATTSDNFGPPTNLGAPINTPSRDGGPEISADGLTFVFNSDRPGGFGQRDLYLATRATIANPFGSVVNLGPTINTGSEEVFPSLSADALSLYFYSNRPGGFGDQDLWVTTRASLAAPWGTPVNLGPKINGRFTDYNPEIAWDGRSILFTSTRSGIDSIYQAAVVPEPSALGLAACGGLLLAGLAAHRAVSRSLQ